MSGILLTGSSGQSSPGEESPSTRPRLVRQGSSIGDSPGSVWIWLKSIFTMSDKDIHTYCGDDALQYIRFQRHIIFYLTIIVIFCIGVILPLNFQVLRSILPNLKTLQAHPTNLKEAKREMSQKCPVACLEKARSEAFSRHYFIIGYQSRHVRDTFLFLAGWVGKAPLILLTSILKIFRYRVHFRVTSHHLSTQH